MTVRKIDLMHKLYDYGSGKCADCSHLIESKANRTYFKCEIYGNTDSEASDWRKRYDACGLKNKEIDMKNRNPVIRLVSKSQECKHETQCEGQISLF